MAKNRLDIDNFFRENLSDFELSEQKGSWEVLNSLLDEKERKMKNRKWFLFIVCFVVILSSGLLVLLPEKELKENRNNKTEQSNTPVAREKNSSKNETDKSSVTIPSDKNETGKNESKDVEQVKPENNSSAHEEENNSRNPVRDNAVNHSDAAHDASSEHSAVIKTEINRAAPQPNIPLDDSDKTVVHETKDSEISISNRSQENDTVNANTISQETANQNLIASDSSVIKSVNIDSLTVNAKNNPAADSAISKELIPAKTNFLNFNIYVGLNIYNTSSTFSNQENISPLVGLEFTHSFSSNFTIGLAGLYSLEGGYHLSDTAAKESYFLDKNVSEQTIQIHQLHKLYFPLALYYVLAKKHSVFGAIQMSYLVNTNGNYAEINKTSGVTAESQKNNVKGYMDGIKSTNTAISLGYKYRMIKIFDVSTRITRELTEAYTKEYFYGVNTKPSWSFQTFLIVKF